MSKLASYDPNSHANKQIAAKLGDSIGVESWKRTIVLGTSETLTGLGLTPSTNLTTTQYEPGENARQGTIPLQQNRYNSSPSAHLLLLNRHVKAKQTQNNLTYLKEVTDALSTEARNTSFPHPGPQSGLDLTVREIRALLKNPNGLAAVMQYESAKAHFKEGKRSSAPKLDHHPSNIQAWQDYSKLSGPQQKLLKKAIIAHLPKSDPFKGLLHAAKELAKEYREQNRFGHHEHKSANRLSSHFTGLGTWAGQRAQTSGDPISQHVTEARGEFLAAKTIVTCMPDSDRYQLKLGYGTGGHQGIDQIWAKRARNNGKVLEYLVVEAKGSQGAQLGWTDKGEQMSERWVFVSLLELASDTNRSLRDRTLARKVVEAMFSLEVPVKGVVIQSNFEKDDPTGGQSRMVFVRMYGNYNRDGVP
ncbi:MAG TPA: hypothetical protein VF263_03105 [Longimicrobiaceae bacterium]